MGLVSLSCGHVMQGMLQCRNVDILCVNVIARQMSCMRSQETVQRRSHQRCDQELALKGFIPDNELGLDSDMLRVCRSMCDEANCVL